MQDEAIPEARHWRAVITVEPGKRSGQPCIRGMRIAVDDILGYLAGGMTEAELLADFPELTQEDILACREFSAERSRRTQHSTRPSPRP